MTRATLMMTAVALMSLPGGLLSDAATAQEKHRVVIKTLPENTKFTQQHAIDVGDVPGCRIRPAESRHRRVEIAAMQQMHATLVLVIRHQSEQLERVCLKAD